MQKKLAMKKVDLHIGKWDQQQGQAEGMHSALKTCFGTGSPVSSSGVDQAAESGEELL